MHAERRKRIHEAMLRLSDGERDAFDVLLDELWPVILAFAERGVGPGADAEDVAQEVFFKICARIADFDRERDAVSWAFGIASYEVMTQRRKRQRRREVHDDATLVAREDRGASQEQQLLQHELEEALRHALGKLTEDDQRALGVLNEAKPVAVAGSTLRKRRQRALERLRSVWRRIYGEA